MLNLRHIEVFYAIMRTGSITEAARVLNVTQPAVSSALKQLETRLGMPLFDRTGGRLHATPEAKALLPDVAEIFGRLGAVERLSRDLAQGTRGLLAVAATPPLCDGYVAKAVATFSAQRPGVEFALHAIPSAVALDRVINREVDIAVVYEPVVSSAVRVDVLARVAIGCILPARHPLAKRRVVRAADLPRYPLITYLPQALLRPYIDRALGTLRTPLNVVVRTTTSATAISLAVNRAGIALIETALFAARPIPGFVARPIEPLVELRILLLSPRRARASRIAAAFVEHLRGVFP
jgi:DNA-binding transcriptional LysR family regulator